MLIAVASFMASMNLSLSPFISSERSIQRSRLVQRVTAGRLTSSNGPQNLFLFLPLLIKQILHRFRRYCTNIQSVKLETTVPRRWISYLMCCSLLRQAAFDLSQRTRY